MCVFRGGDKRDLQLFLFHGRDGRNLCNRERQSELYNRSAVSISAKQLYLLGRIDRAYSMRTFHLLRDKAGVAAVEFALTTPFFLAALVGVVQISFIMWTQLGLQNGVEVAARCSSVNKTLCPDALTIQSYAAQNALGLNLPPSVFSYTNASCGNQVSASYVLPLLSRSFPSTSLLLTARACSPS